MEPILTLEQAEAAEKAARAKFEATTTAFYLGDDPVTMAEARIIFEKYHPGDDWKRPVSAMVPYDDAEKFQMAVAFYHGSAPRIATNNTPVGMALVTDGGYEG